MVGFISAYTTFSTLMLGVIGTWSRRGATLLRFAQVFCRLGRRGHDRGRGRTGRREGPAMGVNSTALLVRIYVG